MENSIWKRGIELYADASSSLAVATVVIAYGSENCDSSFMSRHPGKTAKDNITYIIDFLIATSF